jgi:lipoprotein NlpI
MAGPAPRAGARDKRIGKFFIALLALTIATSGGARADGLDLTKAGLAAQQQGGWDEALQLYTQALDAADLPVKSRARVLGLRANAHGVKGLYDKATVDFAAAMEITPNDPAPYVGRSIVHRQMGDYSRAIADDDAALGLAPDFTLAYTNRGLANFYAGRFAAAAEDFTRSQAADPGEPDFVLWLHLSRARAGQDDAAELARNAAKIDLRHWAGPAVALFLGRIKPDELAAAAADKNPTIQLQQGCEASFYLGEDALLHGRGDDANRLFQSVLDACALYKTTYASFCQAYGAAREELKRIRQ